MASRRAAYALRRFSSSTSKSEADAASAGAAAPTSSEAATSLPSWLNRWLHLWDRESGTHEILQLKERVNASSQAFDAKRRQVSEARASLDKALQAFEDSQLQHTSLLQSRDRWTPSQAMEFAKLLEKEVSIRQELDGAKRRLSTLESEQLQSMNSYMNHLRRRYHEEQLWQDKWRIYSTFGTWGLIVLNSVVFLISQYLYRMRENQRLKDVKGLLEQSLAANEGTLRAVREQQHQNVAMHDDTAEEESAPKRKQGKVTGAEDTKNGNGSDMSEVSSVDKSVDGPEEAAVATPGDQPDKLFRWAIVRRYTSAITKKLLPENGQVDVPSAILGASATGMAWVVALALSSSRRGAQ